MKLIKKGLLSDIERLVDAYRDVMWIKLNEGCENNERFTIYPEITLFLAYNYTDLAGPMYGQHVKVPLLGSPFDDEEDLESVAKKLKDHVRKTKKHFITTEATYAHPETPIEDL